MCSYQQSWTLYPCETCVDTARPHQFVRRDCNCPISARAQRHLPERCPTPVLLEASFDCRDPSLACRPDLLGLCAAAWGHVLYSTLGVVWCIEGPSSAKCQGHACRFKYSTGKIQRGRYLMRVRGISSPTLQWDNLYWGCCFPSCQILVWPNLQLQSTRRLRQLDLTLTASLSSSNGPLIHRAANHGY